MSGETEKKWKILISGPTIAKPYYTNRTCTIQKAIEFAAWSLWTNLRYKVGTARAEIRDDRDFLNATVKVETHISE